MTCTCFLSLVNNIIRDIVTASLPMNVFRFCFIIIESILFILDIVGIHILTSILNFYIHVCDTVPSTLKDKCKEVTLPPTFFNLPVIRGFFYSSFSKPCIWSHYRRLQPMSEHPVAFRILPLTSTYYILDAGK